MPGLNLAGRKVMLEGTVGYVRVRGPKWHHRLVLQPEDPKMPAMAIYPYDDLEVIE